MQLQQRLSFSILPAIIGPLLIVGAISYYQLNRTAEVKAVESMQTAVEQLSVSIGTYIDTSRTSVGFLAIASPITTYVAAPTDDARYGLYQPNVLALLNDYQKAYASNLSLQILKNDGSMDIDWPRDDADLPAPANYDEFVTRLRRAGDGPLTRVIPARTTGKPLVIFGTTLTNPITYRGPGAEQAVLGYLVAVFDLSPFVARADAVRFGKSGDVMLTDGRGRSWPGSSRPPAWNPAGLASDFLSLAAPHKPLAWTTDSVERFVTFRRPHPQLLAIGSIESREVHTASTQIAAIVTILTLLAVVTMHRLIYATVRRVLLEPAQRLIAIARDMAAGNLQVPVNIAAEDELGDLSRALRDLGNNLSESREQSALREAEREYAVEQLKCARDRAEAASRAKSEFLARMSHEIRTPMNGVLGMTELLQATALDNRQRRYAETVSHSAVSLLAIINDILDFSKIESGKFELETAPFDLRQVVEDAAELLAERAASKGLELVCDIPNDMPATLHGDGLRLRQVLVNLIGNAVKFTEQGQIVIRTRAEHVVPGSTNLHIEVEDTGIGIQPANLAIIFDPFAQEDGTTTRRFGGTGLGLSICKQLVELMGGTISATSTCGSGSVFACLIPFAYDTSSVTGRDPASLQDVHVLLIDGHPAARSCLARQLGDWKARVTLAESGADALEILHGRPAGTFQLLLMDLAMPGTDALAWVHALRSDPAIGTLPVIGMVPVAGPGSATDWQAAGITAVVNKPVRQAHLRDCVDAALGGQAPPASAEITNPGPRTHNSSRQNVRRTVLLVEDNAVNQEVAKAMLEGLNCDVHSAWNGREALEILRQKTFDAVLMDCQMPELDGYAATLSLREWEKRHQRPRMAIIALTANALESDEQKCLDAGMDGYVSKPFTMEQLRQALDKFAPGPALQSITRMRTTA